MNTDMFCWQCQETAGSKGCTRMGVCGKKPETSALQDVLVYATKGLGQIAARLRAQGFAVERDEDRMMVANLFATITNANFDDAMLEDRIRATCARSKALAARLDDAGGLSDAALWQAGDRASMLAQAGKAGILSTRDEDVRSLRSLVTLGLKGMAAYLEHADALGKSDPELDAFIEEALAKTLDENLSAADLTALALETGSKGVSAMALLDAANTGAYGHPEMTKVSIGAGTKPGILVSGHDLRDLEMLLQQTEGTGVDVYSHCEMLPAHYYPAFKKYAHFRGNYGNAWWRQKEEFESFNGPVLLTTNCLVPPRESYRNRVYTTGVVGFPGCRHIPGEPGETKDFSSIIAHARTCPPPVQIERGEIVGGFAHNQLLALAGKVVEAVKSGAIRKFVVMAGCDGRAKSRSYYTEFAQKLPEDVVILTAGCAKYRYNKLNLGEINGIPRVLDAGQCNDSYSLAVVALKLKEAFGLDDVNKLPIVFNIGWYEQKAVIVLLALLSLGVKNIHLGPTLPAFLSPSVAGLLAEQFGIAGIGTVEEDLKKLVG